MRTVHPFLPWTVREHQSWSRHAAVGLAISRAVSSTAAEVVGELSRQVPTYREGRYAEAEAGLAIGQFVRLVGDPSAPMAETLEYFREIGRQSAGRDLRDLNRTLLLATRVAVRHLTEVVTRADPALPAQVYGRVTAAIIPYLDTLMEAATEGASHAAPAGRRQIRERLALLLADGGVQPESLVVQRLAAQAGWSLPATVAAIALDGPPPSGLPDSVLTAARSTEPFLVIPDPDGPGQQRRLSEILGTQRCVIGTTEPLRDLGNSLAHARRTLQLLKRGAIQADPVVRVTDQLPILVITHDPAFVRAATERLLKPLLTLPRPSQRRTLAQTLLALLECGFSATAAADRMHAHPQTIRYRRRQLDILFGTTIRTPEHHMELQIALHSWLTEADYRS